MPSRRLVEGYRARLVPGAPSSNSAITFTLIVTVPLPPFGDRTVIRAFAALEGRSVGFTSIVRTPCGQVPEVHGIPEPSATPPGGVRTRKFADGSAIHESTPVPALRMSTVARPLRVGSLR